MKVTVITVSSASMISYWSTAITYEIDWPTKAASAVSMTNFFAPWSIMAKDMAASPSMPPSTDLINRSSIGSLHSGSYVTSGMATSNGPEPTVYLTEIFAVENLRL